MSITSTSQFFHVSEVSVFCCLTNSIRPEGCREYMHRSLSLGSGRDGSCGGANISEMNNAQKKVQKWGKISILREPSFRRDSHSFPIQKVSSHPFLYNLILQALLPHVY